MNENNTQGTNKSKKKSIPMTTFGGHNRKVVGNSFQPPSKQAQNEATIKAENDRVQALLNSGKPGQAGR